MKEILDEDSRKALITYKLQRAYETLKEAEVMTTSCTVTGAWLKNYIHKSDYLYNL